MILLWNLVKLSLLNSKNIFFIKNKLELFFKEICLILLFILY